MSVINPTTKTANSLISHSNKHECLKMIKVLNHNLKNLEREQHSIIFNKKNDKELGELYEMFLINESNRKNERSRLIQKLDQITQMILRFKKETKIVKPSQEIIDTLKSLMEQVDASISEYKEQMHMKCDEFVNEEKLLTKEIDTYDKKILAWSSTSDNNVSNHKVVKSELNEKLTGGSELLKEVVDFDNYLLTNGGHNGGWDEIDHNLFLKTRNKHKGKVGFLDELEGLVATKTRNEIENHEEWYKTYLSLNELKKKAIKQWKESKMSAKNQVVNLVDEELKLNKEIEKELKSRLEKQAEMERRELNKKINKWKLDRALKQAEEEQKNKLQEEKRIAREEREREKKEELRLKVLEFKKQKQELNEYIEMEQILFKEAEEEMKRKNAKKEILNFQQRDYWNLKEKQERLKAKELEKEEKLRRLEQTKERVEVESDPSRLYKMTSTWKNRVTTPRRDEVGTKSERVLATPRITHLAVPTWRQNV